ncbi:MAG: hypothetical protein AVDCRST_MAG93-4437, partial [uncultured Chloroflexia bacterium]
CLKTTSTSRRTWTRSGWRTSFSPS